MEPRFPLANAPVCLMCKNLCTPDIVSPGNLNGNAGRPFYVCKNNSCPRGFSTWDDYQGIDNGNPRCWCRSTSRRGKTNGPTRTYFYSCPAGRCRYTADAPLAPQAKILTVAGGPPRYSEHRPYVDMEAQAVERRPAYHEHRHYCCVVM